MTPQQAALEWVGTPYRHQAALKGVGCDCLGLVRGVHAELFGVLPDAPPYASDWAEADPREALIDGLGRWLKQKPREQSAPGNVLVFRFRAELPAKHAAILIDDSTMVHAHAGASVAIVPLAPWWRRRLAAVFAFPEPRRS